MNEQMDWAEAARYLAGESSAAERTRFEAWMVADPARTELVDSLRPLMVGRAAPTAPVDVELAWRKLEARTRGASPQVRRGRSNGRMLWLPPIRWPIAASALVAAAAAAIWLVSEVAQPGADARNWKTANGTRQKITLGKGTEVVLAPGSTLTAANTSGEIRTVRLTGEAYFAVAHNDRLPFVVLTTGAVVRDIGTRFLVRASALSARTDVVVAEGAVEIKNAAGGVARVEVRAGQTAFSENGKVSIAIPVNLDQSLGWLQGRLAFVDVPLSKVASELERWYGTPVRVEGDAIRTRTLTVTFAGESFEQALDAIVRTLNVRYTRDSKTGAVVISGR